MYGVKTDQVYWEPGKFLICLETLRYWLSQPVWTSSSTPLTQLV